MLAKPALGRIQQNATDDGGSVVDYLISVPNDLPPSNEIYQIIQKLDQTWKQFERATGHENMDKDAVWAVTRNEIQAYLNNEKIDVPPTPMYYQPAADKSRELARLRTALEIVQDGYSRIMDIFGDKIVIEGDKVHEHMLAAKKLVEGTPADVIRGDKRNLQLKLVSDLKKHSDEMDGELKKLHEDIHDFVSQFASWRKTIENMHRLPPEQLAAKQQELQRQKQDELRQWFGVVKDSHGNEKLQANADRIVAAALKHGKNILFAEAHEDPKAASRVLDQLKKNLPDVKGLAYELIPERKKAFEQYFKDHDLAALEKSYKPSFGEAPYLDHLRVLEFAYHHNIPIEFIDNRVARDGSFSVDARRTPHDRFRLDAADAPMARQIDEFAQRVHGPVFVMSGGDHADEYGVPGFSQNTIAIDYDYPFVYPNMRLDRGEAVLPPGHPPNGGDPMGAAPATTIVVR